MGDSLGNGSRKPRLMGRLTQPVGLEVVRQVAALHQHRGPGMSHKHAKTGAAYAPAFNTGPFQGAHNAIRGSPALRRSVARDVNRRSGDLRIRSGIRMNRDEKISMAVLGNLGSPVERNESIGRPRRHNIDTTGG